MFSESQAQTNLRSISQKTNYLQDWAQHPPLHKQTRDKKRQIIIEQTQEQPRKESPLSNKVEDIIKHHYEKYGVRRYIEKQSTINQIFYPVLDQKLIHLGQRNSKKQYPHHSNYKRKLCSNGKVVRIIDPQFTKKKLQTFQNKHMQQQKEVNLQMQKQRSKEMPGSVKIKRSLKINNNSLSNPESMQAMKRIAFKHSKRYSVPHLNGPRRNLNNQGIDQFFHDI